MSEQDKDSLFIKNPYAKPLLILAIVFFLFLSVIDNSSIFMVWPYLLMSILTLTVLEIKDKKWAMIAAVIALLLLFGALSLFYYIIPISNNYKPIPLGGLGSIFNMVGGEYKISYYPDYLKAGDNVLLIGEICTPVCQICENCTFSGYFTNEEGRQQTIFVNETLKERPNIQYMFTGHDTEILMKNENRTLSFYVPQPSLYQAFFIAAQQSPYIVVPSFVAGIIGLFLFFYSIFVNRDKIKSYLINFGKKKRKEDTYAM